MKASQTNPYPGVLYSTVPLIFQATCLLIQHLSDLHVYFLTKLGGFLDLQFCSVKQTDPKAKDEDTTKRCEELTLTECVAHSNP